ncbi:MAG: hypothetical protein LBN30_09620 [Oscillospiraceae bacterium]|nr:hypothetical protein [Oscillospiraceae bacterium]
MDLAFFEGALPVVSDIVNVVIASAWALLLGNLVFQAAKSMLSGMGFEADDPKELFLRTFVFGFLLLASRQICNIGLGLSSALIELLQVPDAVQITLPDENVFAIGASWLLVIIIGVILVWQIVKLFLEVGERYFIVGLLTMLAPWAFSMGGSKSTEDIFKGWARMFATMCLMMVLNVVILKLLLSAIGYMPNGPECIPWVIFVIAISRVGRKLDGMIQRIGLNPAPVGGKGNSLPGRLLMSVARSALTNVVSTAGASAGGGRTAAPSGGGTRTSRTSSSSSRTGTSRTTNRTNRGGTTSRGNTTANMTANTAANTNSTQNGGAGTGNTSPANPNATVNTQTPGSAGTSSQTSTSRSDSTARNGNTPRGSDTRRTNAPQSNTRGASPRNGNAGIRPIDIAGPAGDEYARPGTAGIPPAGGARPVVAPQTSPTAANGGAGTQVRADAKTQQSSRYTSVPPKPTSGAGNAGGNVNTGGARIQQGGVNATSLTNITAPQSDSRREHGSAVGNAGGAAAQIAPTTPTIPTAPTKPITPTAPRQSQNHGNAGKDTRRSAPPTTTPPPATKSGTQPAVPIAPSPTTAPRQGGNAPVPLKTAPPSVNPPPATRESAPKSPDSSRKTSVPPNTEAPGMAGSGKQPKNSTKPAAPYKPTPPNVGKGAPNVMSAKPASGKKNNKNSRRGGRNE